MKRSATFAIAILATCAALQATAQDIRFRAFGVAKGLSQSSVCALLQDHQGFLWLGTQDGINRFDGYNFRVFKHDPARADSLPDNWINCFAEDRAGNLWVGTRSGLARFDPRTERFSPFRASGPVSGGESGHPVQALVLDKQGRLWCGLGGGGLAMLEQPEHADPERASFVHHRREPDRMDSLPSDQILTLVEDRQHLWIGTAGAGLAAMSLAKPGNFERFRMQPGVPGTLADDVVSALLVDRKDRLWIGTRAGYGRYEGEGHFSFWKLGEDASLNGVNYVRALAQDHRGTLWAGTRDGLCRFNPEAPTARLILAAQPDQPGGLVHNDILALLSDRYGTLWVGTYGAGICQVEPLSESIATYQMGKGGLSHEQVWCITRTRDGVLWIGNEGGLNRLDPGAQRFVHYRHQPGDQGSLNHPIVKALCEPAPGVLWIGTEAGICILDRARDRISRLAIDPNDPLGPASDRIWSINQTRDGSIWVTGNGQGISHFPDPSHPDRFERLPHQPGSNRGPSDNWVMAMTEDEDGNLWIGTHDHGLDLYQPGRPGAGFTNFRNASDNPTSLSNDSVFCIFVDSAKRLWVATYGGGLNLGDARDPGRFRAFRQAEGLPNDSTYGILEDHLGRLWISTNKGIACLDPKTLTFTNYDARDGLQSDEFNAGAFFRDHEGRMYFGGIKGVSHFQPEDLFASSGGADVVIDRVLLFNRPLPITPEGKAGSVMRAAPNYLDRLVLDHRDYVFSFEFAAHHYANPERNRTAYKLEGLDKDWIDAPVDRRYAAYANVAPGHYTFRVKGAPARGPWSEQEARIELVIESPPWRTWWALSFYALVIVGSAFTWWKLQQAKLRRARELNERLQVVDRLKDEFLANTSHELRTPLGGMIGLAESLMDGATGQLPPETVRHLSMLVSSGRRLANLVNDILDFSRMRDRDLPLHTHPVDLHSAAEVVLTLSRPFLQGKELELVNDISAALPPALADEDRLQQIFYNLIGNAIKFTERGRISLSAAYQDHQLVISVADTGAGIPADRLEDIFQSFVQLDGRSDRAQGGTGLGLAVTRKLVELHGGRIWVVSGEGVGSVFSFTLPVAEMGDLRSKPRPELNPIAAEGETPTPTELIEAQGSSPFHILIVDDEAVNRQVVFNYLAMTYQRISQAASGAQALELIDRGGVDLVLLDIMMPRLSGFEVCREIRVRFPLHRLPIIFFSARNRVVDLAKAFTLGGNDYLTKPVIKDELMAKVSLHLDLVQANRDIEERNRIICEKSERLFLLEEEKMSSLRTLTAGVAHEVNNAMNLSTGSTQNLSSRLGRLERFLFEAAADEADPEIMRSFREQLDAIKDDLGKIEQGLRRTTGIVRDLYAFTSLRDDRLEQVLLAKCLKAALALVRPRFGERVQFELEVPDDLALTCRPNELNQVFLHLLTNACEACGNTQDACPRVLIKALCVGDQVQIAINDNGLGIRPDHRERLFEPFFSTKGVGEGTGLGLSIAYGITRAHQGRIEVDSIPGRGSTFTVWLPLNPSTHAN